MNGNILVFFALIFTPQTFGVASSPLFLTIQKFLAAFSLQRKDPDVGNVETYKITKYSTKLSDEDVDNTLERAFNYWSDRADIVFAKTVKDGATIQLSFETGDHGDGFNFDGPGGLLAHALKSKIHFDDDEDWVVDTNSGTSLYKVAVHEIGHSLGLGHSDYESATMF